MKLGLTQRPLVAVALLTASCFACGGCAGRRSTDYSQVPLVEVSGTVILDGQPLALAAIIFEGEDHSFSIGQTDAAGRYRLQYNSEKSGVTPGRKTVRISTRPGAFTEAGAPTEEKPGVVVAAAELLPPRYNTRSELTVVVASDTPTFRFDLRSAGLR